MRLGAVLELRESFRTVIGGSGLKAFKREVVDEERHEIDVVVNDQNAARRLMHGFIHS